MRSYISAIIVSLSAIFAPIQSVMVTMLVLILADLVTGIIAARKRGEAISSSSIRRTVSKILIYEVAIALGFIAQAYLIKDIIPVANLIGSVVGLVELKSVLENLNSISGQDLLKSVIDKLGSQNKPQE